jgi:hypothetical protein
VRIVDGELTTDLNLKALVFNTTGLNVTVTNTTTIASSLTVPSASQLVLLEQFLDNWWAQNANLITAFNNKQPGDLSSSANAEDINSFSHEYYKFYASAFSRFNAFDKHGSGSFNLTSDLGQLLDYLVFKNTSNSVIGLIGAFVVAAACLVSIVIYKHRRAAASLAKKGGSSKKMFVNLNNMTLNGSGGSGSGSNNNSSTGSSFNISDQHSTADLSASEKKFSGMDEEVVVVNNAAHQSTRDLTSSPNLVAKFGNQMVSYIY